MKFRGFSIALFALALAPAFSFPTAQTSVKCAPMLSHSWSVPTFEKTARRAWLNFARAALRI